jgi:uncharacterized membrane protein YgcG
VLLSCQRTEIAGDGGETFVNVYGNIAEEPKGYVLVARIEPSHFDPGTAYAALDNHRNDDYKPYLFKTTDFGKSWTNVTGNLPALGNINALREDYDNPDLLFVGTEFGLYVTLDGCKEWKKFMTGLPSVRVDDILIHPRDRDLIVATHGRSIWIADDISPLEQLAQKSSANVMLFEPRAAIQWKNDQEAQRHVATQDFHGQNPQGGTALSFWANADMGEAKIEILEHGKVIRTITTVAQAGMNRIQWDMLPEAPPTAAGAAGAAGGQAAAGAAGAGAGGQGGGGRGGRGGGGVPFVAGGRGGGGGFGGGGAGGPTMLPPGTYTVRLNVGGQILTTPVSVLEDVWMRKN